jgi:hypothetical protein
MLEARSGFPFSLHTEDGQVAGNVNTHRFPVNVVLNLHAERLMKFRQYRFALRAGFNNFTNHRNPTAVNSVIGSPRFLSFYGNEGRHLVFRLRWLGTR